MNQPEVFDLSRVIEDKHSKTIPVMETTIEGAQKRIEQIIQAETEGKETYLISDLEYIGVFLDSVGDEMAAITSSCNSLHARYVEALAAIDEWKDNFETVSTASARRLEEKIKMQKEIDRLREENEALRKGNLNNLHAAHDNR